jgi:hypothetical protein
MSETASWWNQGELESFYRRRAIPRNIAGELFLEISQVSYS